MKYQRCTRCVMDNASDDTIRFDSNGVCNYCTDALAIKDRVYFPNSEGQKKLEIMASEIKKAGKGKQYDCVIGLSGGLDSSYVALLAYRLKLRALAIHIDDGYDTDISKENLRKIIAKTGFDYKVIQPDAEQFNSLTLAFMKAGVPNIAIPQDNVLFAFLYEQVRKYRIKYVLSGLNFALECILQVGNTHSNSDVRHIKAINKQFSGAKLNKLSFISSNQKLVNRYLLGFKTMTPLNYVDYNRKRAFDELKEFCGFEYYGRKHLENKFTAFTQLKWFPEKFGVDKRTSHLSSMIVSGQMTRDEALRELELPLYDEDQMNSYLEEIKEALHISDEEFDEIMSAPTHAHDEYPVEDNTFSYMIVKAIRKQRRKKLEQQ